MKIELPDPFIEHINSKGEYFYSELSVFSKKPSENTGNSDRERSVDHHPSSHLSDDDIKINTESVVNILGEEIVKTFPDPDNDTYVGFKDDKLEEYSTFIDSLAKRKEIRDLLSDKYLDKLVFQWLKEKYLKSSEVTLTKYITKNSENDIKPFRIAFPIQNLFIDSSFSVGNCKFTFLRKNLFDDLEEHYQKEHGKEPSKTHQWLRDNFQGKVIAYHELTAEQDKAIEIAKREAQKSLVGLRFYSPSATLPKLISTVGFFESNIVPATHVFAFSEGLPDFVINPKIKGQPFWNITDQEIKRMEDLSMYLIDDLLKKSELTDFQETLTNCLFLLDKSITSSDIQDKLVFLLVCLETLLLKDSGEPIKKSIGLRLSFLGFEDIEDRKKVLDYISEAYKYRSSYIHHGRRTDIDDDLLTYFQAHVRTAILESLNKMEKFDTKLSFLNYLDDLVLTGDKA
jgi:hypothetical protein